MAITEQLADLQREIDAETSTIKSYLSERLASDDQILARLPGIVSKLVTEPEDSEDEKSIDQWCKAIVSFRAGEIKARVDAVYLNTLSEHASNGHSETPDEELKERKVALQAEMEELHSEIASVTEMVVEHELRKPMSEMKERKDREVTQARGAWLNYVSLQPDCSKLVIDSSRFFRRSITWASASIRLPAARRTWMSCNKHSRMSAARPRSVCQMRMLDDQHHQDEELLLVHLWHLHQWSS